MKLFDQEALKLFEQKGITNSEKVRRIMQLTTDMTGKSFGDLSVLDLGCGEGVYTLEAGLKGARATGIDGRNHRLKFGAEVAKRHELDNVNFHVDDVRNVVLEKYGRFDVIYLLGLLYHLDEPELFDILKNLYAMCNDVLIIDTTIALSSPLEVHYEGKKYFGIKYDEHIEGDSEELMIDKRIMASIGNKLSFLPTKKSLVRFLNEIGFTSVLESHVPIEHKKTETRITLVAVKGKSNRIESYPWINNMSESEIEKKINDHHVEIPFVVKPKVSFKVKLKLRLDKWLDKKGYELKKKITN